MLILSLMMAVIFMLPRAVETNLLLAQDGCHFMLPRALLFLLLAQDGCHFYAAKSCRK